jgi:hypothetical protein
MFDCPQFLACEALSAKIIGVTTRIHV